MKAASHFRYVLDDPARYGNPEQRVDVATAPGYQLFFSCFMGDIDLAIDGVDFGTKYGWVATLGLAVGIVNSLQRLPAQGVSHADFLESEDRIAFRLQDFLVRVSCSYSTNVANIAYDDLLKLAGGALTDLLNELYSKYPSLRENPSLVEMLTKLKG